ncbi:SDR family oxidoreductase [Desulfatitalea alkaliphila]|uniref:SDR family oxidoreductase n=1 Tax=Desulfatitalea alkaliphila TaxID=2929485 RepID=A0AA41R6V3_9BACT|nr:SDR family oxidoreductase [Desulfatitalea alkaliphila]MCJ8502791.1 SDR family oxidoreductase [Desulfatitalea alkaliphila]
MVNFQLDGKIALITGASRGIGAAIAETLAAYGAHCILVSRKIDALKQVEQKIVQNGGKAESIACHMGQLDKIEALFAEIKERHGLLHILVNNAATNPYFGDMMGADEGAWNKTFEVNLKGPFFMIQHAARLMEESGGGAIVNVASINGVRPAPLQGIYSMSKAAMISMTKAFAKELAGRKIRVNALLPGLTHTKFADALISNDEIYQYALQTIPMNRHAQPEEMAGAVLYLVSDASSFTTGTYIVCDGGSLA